MKKSKKDEAQTIVQEESPDAGMLSEDLQPEDNSGLDATLKAIYQLVYRYLSREEKSELRRRIQKYQHALESQKALTAKIKDQRAELEHTGLESKIESLLREEGLPDVQRTKLRQVFVAQVQMARQEANAVVCTLPDEPPEMWKSGQGETALEFLQRVYSEYLEAGILTWKWLREKDPKLAKSASVKIGREPELSAILKLPLTESDLLDQEYQQIIDQYGQDVVDRIYRIRNTLYSRKSRQNKNSYDNEP